MTRSLFLSWIVLFFILFEGHSQSVEFERFHDEHGLISNDITAIVKDKEGFLWIGTKEGLEKYDGFSIKHFVNDSEDPHVLPSSRVNCLLASRDHKIYVGLYRKGLSVFDKRTEVFQNYFHDEHNAASLSGDSVMALYEAQDGVIWIGTDKGLDKFDPRTKKITHYSPYQNYRNKAVSNIVGGGASSIWLIGPCNRPCRFDTRNNAKTKIYGLATNSFTNTMCKRRRSKRFLWQLPMVLRM